MEGGEGRGEAARWPLLLSNGEKPCGGHFFGARMTWLFSSWFF